MIPVYPPLVHYYAPLRSMPMPILRTGAGQPTMDGATWRNAVRNACAPGGNDWAFRGPRVLQRSRASFRNSLHKMVRAQR